MYHEDIGIYNGFISITDLYDVLHKANHEEGILSAAFVTSMADIS